MFVIEDLGFEAVLMLPSLEILFYRSTNIKLSTKEAHNGKKHSSTKFQNIKFKGNDWIHNWIQ